jgi:hypothetical protein
MKSKTIGTGSNKGHGGNTPNLAVIRERDLTPWELNAQAAGGLEPVLSAFTAGKIKIMVGWHSVTGWHMSISHPDRYPTWDEIANARYKLLPADSEFAMMLPPPSEYVNLHNFCFHLHETPADFDTLPKPSTAKGIRPE